VLAGLDAHDEDRLLNIRVDVAGDGTDPFAKTVLKPVKPCARCPIPNIDPATATSSPHVNDALQAYRSNRLMDGAITFGMNAIVLSGADTMLRVGQKVSGNFDFS
jgi:uncharacterized protein